MISFYQYILATLESDYTRFRNYSNVSAERYCQNLENRWIIYWRLAPPLLPLRTFYTCHISTMSEDLVMYRLMAMRTHSVPHKGKKNNRSNLWWSIRCSRCEFVCAAVGDQQELVERSMDFVVFFELDCWSGRCSATLLLLLNAIVHGKLSGHRLHIVFVCQLYWLQFIFPCYFHHVNVPRS